MQAKNQHFAKESPFPCLRRMGDTCAPQWHTASTPVAYAHALEEMEGRVQGILAGSQGELMWALEHPHLYTLGTSGRAQEILRADVPLFETGRGGKATYHGPGQRVVYVMLDLRARTQDLRAYVWHLEEWLIQTLALLGVEAGRRQGRVGLWVERVGREEKIASIGVRVRGWVTYHGVALNVCPDLSYFQGIVPCGLSQYGVTSLEQVTGLTCLATVDRALQEAFFQVF